MTEEFERHLRDMRIYHALARLQDDLKTTPPLDRERLIRDTLKDLSMYATADADAIEFKKGLCDWASNAGATPFVHDVLSIAYEVFDGWRLRQEADKVRQALADRWREETSLFECTRRPLVGIRS